MLQRSKEWFEARRGRFTASNIHRLLGKDSLKKTRQSIETYSFEKAVEYLYGIEEEPEFLSKDLERGIALEPMAFNRFKALKSFDFIDVEESTFIPLGEHAGASPDGYVTDNSNLEIKCPRRNKFFKIVANGSVEIPLQYQAQMQMQMLCSDTEKTYFFNYYIENGIEYWHELIIERDDNMINLIKDRIKTATNIKLDFIDKINKNIQC